LHAGVELSKLNLALEKIVDLLREIKEKGITDEELFKSHNLLEASLIGSLETSSALAGQIASAFILQEPLPEIEKLLKLIRRTTKKDLQKFAQKMFQPKISGFALIYPEASRSLQRNLQKIIARL